MQKKEHKIVGVFALRAKHTHSTKYRGPKVNCSQFFGSGCVLFVRQAYSKGVLPTLDCNVWDRWDEVCAVCVLCANSAISEPPFPLALHSLESHHSVSTRYHLLPSHYTLIQFVLLCPYQVMCDPCDKM